MHTISFPFSIEDFTNIIIYSNIDIFKTNKDRYSEDIVDLFITMQNITKSHCSLFLHEKGKTSDSLLEFIFNHFKIVETQYIDDDGQDNLLLEYY